MRILAVLVVVVVLFEGIEPGSRSIIKRSYSSVKPTHWNYNSDNDDEDTRCPTINNKIRSNAKVSCINGKLYINGEEVKNAKYTDRIDIISNELRINGKFIRRILPSGNNNNNFINKSGLNNNVLNITKGNISTSNKCPSVVQIGCDKVSTSCINGEFYINGEKIMNVKSTDTVEIIANNLKINGKFIRYIPPSGSNNTSKLNGEFDKKDVDGDKDNKSSIAGKDKDKRGSDAKKDKDDDDDDDDDDNDNHAQKRAPNVNMNFCNDVFYKMKDGKLLVNDIEVKNYKPTDKVLIDHNNLYVNGKFIRYVEPKKSNGWPWS